VYINNTSNIHLDAMRPEMILSILQSVQYNHNRQQKDLRLFEFGSSYETQGEEYKETEYLSIVITGATEQESWLKKPLQSDFYSIKRVVQEVLIALGIDKYQISELEDTRFDYGLKYHKGNLLVANIGKVSLKAAQLMEVKTDVYYAELDMAVLLQSQKNNVVVTEDIPKFPSSRRDLAFVVDNSITYDAIERIVKKAGKKLIKEINLFDVYKDVNVLGSDKKSYAISMIFSDPEKSLKDKDIDKVIQQIIEKTNKELAATLR
jgi:phenylalanyl-tRNA synthetase beta chain